MGIVYHDCSRLNSTRHIVTYRATACTLTCCTDFVLLHWKGIKIDVYPKCEKLV